MRRAFMSRRKPEECPICKRKGVSPNTNYDHNFASRDCRYCGAFTSKTYDPLTREWSSWSGWREIQKPPLAADLLKHPWTGSEFAVCAEMVRGDDA